MTKEIQAKDAMQPIPDSPRVAENYLHIFVDASGVPQNMRILDPHNNFVDTAEDLADAIRKIGTYFLVRIEHQD